MRELSQKGQSRRPCVVSYECERSRQMWRPCAFNRVHTISSITLTYTYTYVLRLRTRVRIRFTIVYVNERHKRIR